MSEYKYSNAAWATVESQSPVCDAFPLIFRGAHKILQAAVQKAKDGGITSRPGIRNEIYKALDGIAKKIKDKGLDGL